jgi:predicted nucleotide-binding protein
MARRRIPASAEIEVRELTKPEIDRGISKLRKRMGEVKELDPHLDHHGHTRVSNVESNVRETIRDVFGPRSPEFHEHRDHRIWHGGYNYLDSEGALQAKFAAGIPQTVTMLEGLISRLEEKREEAPSEEEAPLPSPSPSRSTRRVFVVHGHDEAVKETVARFLSKLDLEPIILHEQPSQGRTIIEKFEGHAEVDFAVVLLTPDDLGSAVASPEQARPRARQNVIFELGYFVGRLGRSRVCALHKGNVDILSDYNGVIYVPMDDAQGWRLLLAREIKAAGIEVDLNAAF